LNSFQVDYPARPGRFDSMDSPSPSFSPLGSLIRERIQREGPVPFPWFMEQALYHVEYGYYARPRTRIGRQGDFCTNVTTGSTFGQFVAAQIVEMWGALDQPGDFKVIEQGAEDGQLAIDVLSAIEEASDPPIHSYIIIEPFPAKQAAQRSRLERRFGTKVQWAAALADLEAVNGVFISNELADAMPVHLLEYRDGHWYERCVICSAKNFEFVSLPIASPSVADAVSKLPLPLHTPYLTEVNLSAKRWIKEIRSRLENGFILVVDYGYPRDEYYKPDRTEGTLACYSRHRRSFDPLADPGEKDITAHIDFTSLAESAEDANLHVAGYTDQHHFMVGAAESYLKQLEQEICLAGMRPHHDQFLRKWKALMHPGNMGMAFKYLLLATGQEFQAPSGFKYAREPRRALGLH
jgi:SAM-dependent MidA family methyltransferase